jgi:hypothetical protein
MMTERPAAAADTDDIQRHPDYLPEPDFFDDDDGADAQAPAPADEDGDSA